MAAAKKPKNNKAEGPNNYTPNSKKYKVPMTPAQMKRYNELASSPKTADTIFTLPKGAEKLSVTEKDQMQKRRIADRKRTLARAEAIIRREVGVKTSGVKSSKSTSKPKPKPKPKPKTTFG